MFHFMKEAKHLPGNAQGTFPPQADQPVAETPLVCAHAGRTQQVDPIVTTPVDEVEPQSTQGHPKRS